MLKATLQRELNSLLRKLLDEDNNLSAREEAELNRKILGYRRSIADCEDPPDPDEQRDVRREREFTSEE